MADDAADLFNIALDDSGDEQATPDTGLPRDHQSEEDWRAQKDAWQPRVEQGEIHASLNLPIHRPTKMEMASIQHAVEELYYFRRYAEALQTVERALQGDLDAPFRAALDDYRLRCRHKVDAGQSV